MKNAIAIIALLLLIVPAGFCEPASLEIEDLPVIYETRTKYFAIRSTKITAMRRAGDIARKLEGHVSAVLRWKNISERGKCEIMVFDEPARSFSIVSTPGKALEALIGGDEATLSDRDLAAMLAALLIKRYAQENTIKLPCENAPLWLVAALAEETEIVRSRGRFQLLRARALKTHPLPFAQIFEPVFLGESPDEQFRQNAFWVYRFLREKRNYKEIIDAILSAPEKASPNETFSEAEKNLWWATHFFAQIARAPAGTESLAESGKRFDEAKKILIKIGDAENRVPAEKLVEYEDLRGIRMLAYARMNELASLLAGTNPVWHNAFTELGTFLEMLARDEADSATLHAQWEKVKKTEDDAKQLSAEIRTLLDKGKNVPAKIELKIKLPPVALTGTPMPILVPANLLETQKPQPLRIPAGSRNLAQGKPVSASDKNPIVGELSYFTDGEKDGDEGYEVELAPGTQWIQIDLGKSAKIYAIALWHYHRQKRAYNDVIIQISDDENFQKNVTTVFNNDYDNSSKLGTGTDKVYIETNAGKIVPVDGVQGRYVRFYSAGNTSDRANHYIEAEIYGH